jgi:hypothetical protein
MYGTKNIFYINLLLIFIVFSGCSEVKQKTETPPKTDIIVSAEDSIPGVPSEVNFADYWIRKAPKPDDLLMTKDEIDLFNEGNPVKNVYLIDISKMPYAIDGKYIRNFLYSNGVFLMNADFYVTGNVPVEKSERARIIASEDSSGVPDNIYPKFGTVLFSTMGKLWPTPLCFMEKPNDNEFDQGVVSTLDMSMPVAVLHTTTNGLWSLVQTPMFICWIESNAIALGDIETVKQFDDSTPPVVAVNDKVSIFGSPENKNAIGYLTMGSHLPLKTAGNDFYEVIVPGRGENGELMAYKGYVRRGSDVSVGFLPYTVRNLYTQCFLLFGKKYGWGGMFSERDCSSYIRDVFRCFNIQLPRNSTSQAKASTAIVNLAGYDREMRLNILKTIPPGISLLRMPGHIMIYLGEYNGKPYAIHDFWAWRTPTGEEYEIIHRAARVAVTDLFLGEGSKRGAYIDRLTHITILGNFEVKPGNNK